MLGTCSSALEWVKGYIYTFHMPVFIVISGFLFGKKIGMLMQFIKLDSTGLVMFAANFTLAVGLSLLVECVWRRVPYVSKLIW